MIEGIWELGSSTRKPLDLKGEIANRNKLVDLIEQCEQHINRDYMYIPRDKQVDYINYYRGWKMVYGKLLKECVE